MSIQTQWQSECDHIRHCLSAAFRVFATWYHSSIKGLIHIGNHMDLSLIWSNCMAGVMASALYVLMSVNIFKWRENSCDQILIVHFLLHVILCSRLHHPFPMYP